MGDETLVLNNGEHGLRANVGGELLFGIDEIGLNLPEPVLENGDEAHAAVDGVLQARLCLVGQRVHGVLALRRVELVEQLGHVAGAEDLVQVRELLRQVRWEIRREHALLRALPPLQLARRARCVR